MIYIPIKKKEKDNCCTNKSVLCGKMRESPVKVWEPEHEMASFQSIINSGIVWYVKNFQSNLKKTKMIATSKVKPFLMLL